MVGHPYHLTALLRRGGRQSSYVATSVTHGRTDGGVVVMNKLVSIGFGQFPAIFVILQPFVRLKA